jgi:hypothetical protein
LTGGILDAFAYGNALTRVLVDGEPESLLTECANSRRTAWLETTNMLSMTNMKRLYGFDEESVKAREGFFHLLKTDVSFPAQVRKGFARMMPDSFERSQPAVKKAEGENGAAQNPLEARMEAVTVS